MLQGGQVSLIAQLVKIPLLIVVISFFLFDETPYILGSFFEISKIFFLILIFVSLAT